MHTLAFMASKSSLQLFIDSRLLAAKRRWALYARGDFDPYPPCPNGLSFSPSQRTLAAAAAIEPRLDLSAVKDGGIENWQNDARIQLRWLLKLPHEPARVEAMAETELPIAEGYTRRRVYLRFGPGCDAPVDIVQRAGSTKEDAAKAPVFICMQGTNAGAHLNLGEVRMPADVHKVANGSALALQAADHGYMAVSFERACFGERRERHLSKRSASPTVDAAFHNLVAGETLLGQTVAELEALRRWIDSEIAPGARVYLCGYSAAGTAAIAAAAACPDFAGIAVGGCVGMIRDTLLKRGAGGYNDVPDILRWFEFDGLLALIAPRPCIVIAGEKDHIWPYSAAQPVVKSARSAWNELGAREKLELVQAPHGHTYYPGLMWPAVGKLVAPA